jgi:hypothetical protein
MNRENLLKGAQFLFEHVKDEQFNMKQFRMQKQPTDKEIAKQSNYKSTADCGTVGCFLGWMPFAEGLGTISQDFNIFLTLDWESYCNRIFGIESEQEDGIWEFLLGGEWADIDNSRLGAVQRAIRVLSANDYFSFSCDFSDFPDYSYIKPSFIMEMSC